MNCKFSVSSTFLSCFENLSCLLNEEVQLLFKIVSQLKNQIGFYAYYFPFAYGGRTYVFSRPKETKYL